MSSAALAVVKAVAGALGQSFALIADAVESATDVVASILVLMGIRIARRPADENHPYGHGKIEPLVTFIVVAFLLMSATGIAYQAVINLTRPQPMPESWTLWVLALIIVWKEISYRIVVAKSKATHSTSLKADAWHHRSDAISSAMAFIGISVAVVMGEGYEAADDWAALAAAGFIFYNAFLIFRPALGEVMDEQLYEDLVARIREVALRVEGVNGTEKCFVRKAGIRYQIDLHAVVDGNMPVREGHEVAHRLEQRLREDLPQIGQVLIHIEPSH